MADRECPGCSSVQHVPDGAWAWRCGACQRDVWALRCPKCKNVMRINGPISGSGTVEVRCGSCRRKSHWDKRNLRAGLAEAHRLLRIEVAGRREAAANLKALQQVRVAAVQGDVDHANQQLDARMQALQTALVASLGRTSQFRFESLKTQPRRPSWNPGSLEHEEPAPDSAAFAPPPLGGLASLKPGAKRRHEEAVAEGNARYQRAVSQHAERETDRRRKLGEAKARFEAETEALDDAVERQHAAVDELQARLAAGDPDAVTEFFSNVLQPDRYGYEITTACRVAYSVESKQLVVEAELPDVDVVPEIKAYKFVKTRGEATSTPRPAAERRRIYASLVAQLALRTLNDVFTADADANVETAVLNAHVSTIDTKTGRAIHPCLVTVRVTRDHFNDLNLASVEPGDCLKGLSASVSRSPAEFVPVKPVIEFDMADPRFVKTSDVLAELDARPNLMELTPTEFEGLITNLFEKMGLDTKQTQPSRDGGVDCVAYDARPIFGGKVVIQAKRYKHTVGVSAVRDLFGTMQNEGATKGILVTTSGYGQASHEFANGKPLELIDGGNLLYLLLEHAGIEAKIEVPEDWVDPVELM